MDPENVKHTHVTGLTNIPTSKRNMFITTLPNLMSVERPMSDVSSLSVSHSATPNDSMAMHSFTPSSRNESMRPRSSAQISSLPSIDHLEKKGSSNYPSLVPTFEGTAVLRDIDLNGQSSTTLEPKNKMQWAKYWSLVGIMAIGGFLLFIAFGAVCAYRCTKNDKVVVKRRKRYYEETQQGGSPFIGQPDAAARHTNAVLQQKMDMAGNEAAPHMGKNEQMPGPIFMTRVESIAYNSSSSPRKKSNGSTSRLGEGSKDFERKGPLAVARLQATPA